MNPLSLSKRLLVLEAEVRRRQLAGDWKTTRAQLLAGGQQARKLGAFASTAALSWTALSLLRRGPRTSGHSRTSLTGVLSRGFKLATTLWPAWNAIRQRAAAGHR